MRVEQERGDLIVVTADNQQKRTVATLLIERLENASTCYRC